ncbi:MAG: nuclear transport factor 2 family protein [Myxococcota bacterium]|nr:nuclear transport factor 2 family protein [Myxococcota bacterium]
MVGDPALEERIRQLEAKLARVEDIEAIKALKARYGELADLRYSRGVLDDPARLDKLAGEIAELFTEDAVWEGGKVLGTCRGRDQIRERFRTPTLRFAWHYFVKPKIDVDGEQAQATWDVLAPCTTLDGKAHWMAGAEDDEYRKVGGVWLHSRMRLRVVFMAPYEEGWIKS